MLNKWIHRGNFSALVRVTIMFKGSLWVFVGDNKEQESPLNQTRANNDGVIIIPPK